MSSKRPEPTQHGTKWEVDLRRWSTPERKLGRHYPLGPSTLSVEEARLRAFEKLIELTAAPAQRPIDFSAPPADMPATVADAFKLWMPVHIERANEESEGGGKYVETYDEIVAKEFGATPLAAICAPGGEKLIGTYVKGLKEGTFRPGFKYSGKSIANRLSSLRQLIAWCMLDERRWLTYMPQLPKSGKKRAIVYRWIDEADFRLLRARLYQDMKPGQLAGTLKHAGNTTPADVYIEQRKLYLSWLFYTGHRTADADAWTSDDVGPDTGTYVRWSRKTGAARERFEMPEPLIQDLRAYLKYVGREHFRAGELIGGGPWKTGSTMIQRTRKAVGIETSVNPRVLRRSFARHMALLGYTEKEVAARLGHTDLRMIHDVYVELDLKPEGHRKSKWRPLSEEKREPAPKAKRAARVLALVGGGKPADADDDDDSDNDPET